MQSTTLVSGSLLKTQHRFFLALVVAWLPETLASSASRNFLRPVASSLQDYLVLRPLAMRRTPSSISDASIENDNLK